MKLKDYGTEAVFMAKPAVLTEDPIKVKGARLGSPLNIALVSDLHERRADDVLGLLLNEKPDLIAVAGDTLERYGEDCDKPVVQEKTRFSKWLFINAAYYINNILLFIFRKNRPHCSDYSFDFLEKAAKLAPVYLCPGNHERVFFDDDISKFRELGVKLLENADEGLGIGSENLRIGGLSDDPDLDFLEAFAKKDGFKILLCHRPEYFTKLIKELDIGLILSGHTHGGQIRLFGRGLFSSGQGLFPKLDKGVFDDRLVISAGCSNTLAIPRINNPRELVIIDLQPL